MEKVYSLSQPKTAKTIVKTSTHIMTLTWSSSGEKKTGLLMHSVESVHYSLTTPRSKTPTLMSSQYTTSHKVNQLAEPDYNSSD